MLKACISAIVAGSIMAAPSFAESFLKKIKNLPLQQQKNTSMQQVRKTVGNESFRNFSGTWEGTCTFSDPGFPQNEPDEITISNDQQYLTIDDETWEIGELSGTSQANTYSASNNQDKFSWNEDRTVLMLDTFSTASMHGDQGAVSSSVSHVTVTMKGNDNLSVNGQFKVFMKARKAYSGSFGCSYTRK